ncbi:hypothetical protein BC827DRAFT_279099 [Russula dissimulans]|nr:hypothetical protein BC827DRAFT_279099 [Russula dissimulans]
MDKASKSPPQPSGGSSRGGRPNTARSVQNAANMVRPPFLNDHMFPSRSDVHYRPLLRVTLDRSQDGINRRLPYSRTGQETLRKWPVLYARYRTPIPSSFSLWPTINKGRPEALINFPLPYLRPHHHRHRGCKISHPCLIEWLCLSTPQTPDHPFPQATFTLLWGLPIRPRNYRRQLPLSPENRVFKHFHRR